MIFQEMILIFILVMVEQEDLYEFDFLLKIGFYNFNEMMIIMIIDFKIFFNVFKKLFFIFF